MSFKVLEGQWSASRLGRLTLGEITVGTHSTGGWVDPRAGLGALGKVYTFDVYPAPPMAFRPTELPV